MVSLAQIAAKARYTALPWLGETMRWYLKHARHPLKAYIVGHYWGWFCRPRMWVRYDGAGLINVCLREYVQQNIFFHGYYERRLVEWLKRTLTPADVFWDVGANIGAITLVAARRCQYVVAFEPDPRSVALLANNLRVNALMNVRVVPAALGATRGQAVLLQAGPNNTGTSSILAGHATPGSRVDVPVMRADDFIAANAELKPTVVKVDVEGAEHLVLCGAAELLRSGSVRALVFEGRHDGHGQPVDQAVVSYLRHSGYRVQPLGPSHEGPDDGMLNFLALPAVPREHAEMAHVANSVASSSD